MNLAILPLTALIERAPSFGGAESPDYTRYLVVCGLVIAAVVLGGYAVRRLVGSSLQRRAAERSLRVLDVLPLGTKQRLCVVQCFDRTFVLGQGDKEVRLIAELDAATVEMTPARVQRPPGAGLPASFKALLEGTQREITRAREGRPTTPVRTGGSVPRIEELA